MKTFHSPILALAAGLFLSFALNAQPTSFRIKQSCSFDDAETGSDAYLYNPSEEADRIVAEIVDALGLTKNFVVKASGVRNAVATTEGGQRYILYSTTFLEKFKGDERTRWAAYAVLAHEIGHHLNYDNFGETDMKRRKIYELEADRFSGSVLRMLGARLDQAQSGVESLENEAESNTHPAKANRREAVATGWKKRDEFLRSRGDGGTPSGPTDTDGDGVADARDQCPSEYGTHSSGCPDADEDGVLDKNDRCPYQKGTASNGGCPVIAPTDTDGDGVPDNADPCPSKKGEKRYSGCPDTDGDGVPDNKDDCPNEKGVPEKKGCGDAPAVPDNMVFVKGGTFIMGCKDGRDNECLENEKPAHTVTLSDYWIGKNEVTNLEFCSFLNAIATKIAFNADGNQVLYNGNIICSFTGDGGCGSFKKTIQYSNGNKPGGKFTVISGFEVHPIVLVSWYGATEYCNWLSQISRKSYRLPTEAEWEYAARGGSKSLGFRYAGSNILDEVAWSARKSDKSAPVGKKKANELGIYDMTGNDWEWCNDWYSSDYYAISPNANPSGLDTGTTRVFRGGAFDTDSIRSRISYRFNSPPTTVTCGISFRVVISN